MSVNPHHKEFDRSLQPRERPFGIPSLSLRKRSADHPLVMFVVIVTTAFASMALVPSSGPVFASLGASHGVIARQSDEPRTTAKADRLSQTDTACSGQAWGAENENCLTVIARESGKSATRPVRLIAAAEPDLTTPNVF